MEELYLMWWKSSSVSSLVHVQICHISVNVTKLTTYEKVRLSQTCLP